MIAHLAKESEDEVKHKDWCRDEFNTNQLDTEKENRTKVELEAKVATLESVIDKLADEIKVLQEEIADLHVQIKRAGEVRENENQVFQATVADQREVQRLLKAALTFLEGFYKEKKAALLQGRYAPGEAPPPPPPGFEAYEKNEQSSGVMKLIEQITDDAKNLENEAIRMEEDSQEAYETFIKDSNEAINDKTKESADKSALKASKEEEKAQTEAELNSTLEKLEELYTYKGELHTACDFVLNNFDLRQEARDQEILALKQAKQIPSGAQT